MINSHSQSSSKRGQYLKGRDILDKDPVPLACQVSAIHPSCSKWNQVKSSNLVTEATPPGTTWTWDLTTHNGNIHVARRLCPWGQFPRSHPTALRWWMTAPPPPNAPPAYSFWYKDLISIIICHLGRCSAFNNQPQQSIFKMWVYWNSVSVHFQSVATERCVEN